MIRARMEQHHRTALPGPALYAILESEFRRRRPAICTSCRVPLPYWRLPPDDVSANWFIGTPSECPHGCHVLIAEILTRLWTQYDIDRTPLQ